MYPVQSHPVKIPMDELPHTTDGRRSSEDTVTSEEPVRSIRAKNASELRLAVVEYDEETDRGTIHPPALTGIDRMETWLSANMSAFVELSAWR